MTNDKPYLLMSELGPDSPVRGLPKPGDGDGGAQELTDAYITTLYYSAFLNLHLQDQLPEEQVTIMQEMPRFEIAFKRSYADYILATRWLEEHSGLIATSQAKSYYDEVQAVKEHVTDINGAYEKR